jgi:small GTP-binding protein
MRQHVCLVRTSQLPAKTCVCWVQLVVGLDDAGKTSLVSRIGNAVVGTPRPTVGFSKPVSTALDEFEITLYDLGGGIGIRCIWPQYLPEVHAVVFVVDGSNKDRFPEARLALDELLEHPSCADKAVLLFGNKSDMPESVTEEQLATGLGKISNNQYVAVLHISCYLCKSAQEWASPHSC